MPGLAAPDRSARPGLLLTLVGLPTEAFGIYFGLLCIRFSPGRVGFTLRCAEFIGLRRQQVSPNQATTPRIINHGARKSYRVQRPNPRPGLIRTSWLEDNGPKGFLGLKATCG